MGMEGWEIGLSESDTKLRCTQVRVQVCLPLEEKVVEWTGFLGDCLDCWKISGC